MTRDTDTVILGIHSDSNPSVGYSLSSFQNNASLKPGFIKEEIQSFYEMNLFEYLSTLILKKNHKSNIE